MAITPSGLNQTIPPWVTNTAKAIGMTQPDTQILRRTLTVAISIGAELPHLLTGLYPETYTPECIGQHDGAPCVFFVRDYIENEPNRAWVWYGDITTAQWDAPCVCLRLTDTWLAGVIRLHGWTVRAITTMTYNPFTVQILTDAPQHLQSAAWDALPRVVPLSREVFDKQTREAEASAYAQELEKLKYQEYMRQSADRAARLGFAAAGSFNTGMLDGVGLANDPTPQVAQSILDASRFNAGQAVPKYQQTLNSLKDLFK